MRTGRGLGAGSMRAGKRGRGTASAQRRHKSTKSHPIMDAKQPEDALDRHHIPPANPQYCPALAEHHSPMASRSRQVSRAYSTFYPRATSSIYSDQFELECYSDPYELERKIDNCIDHFTWENELAEENKQLQMRLQVAHDRFFLLHDALLEAIKASKLLDMAANGQKEDVLNQLVKALQKTTKATRLLHEAYGNGVREAATEQNEETLHQDYV